jgi:HK97 family phage portal protein
MPILSIRNGAGLVTELHLLRPDRVEVVPGKGNIPKKYIYKVNEREVSYPVDQITGYSDILHLKNFNPSDDWLGLSQIESASYSIDIHNQASTWNKSLLQNGARPTGVMIVKSHNNSPGYLNEQQFKRLVDQLEDKFMGSKNAGRPIILEGGIDWKEMGYSPKDMDFVETKNSAAREISLAFGVPPQLLGIRGDNTYNNMQEARLAFWEETVLPLIDCAVDSINNWFADYFKGKFRLFYNTNNISALALKQDKVWKRVSEASFMNDNEKRAAVGLTELS